jgi:hypothetical protein
MLPRRQNQAHIIISRQCNTDIPLTTLICYGKVSFSSIFGGGRAHNHFPFMGVYGRHRKWHKKGREKQKRSSPSIPPSLSSTWKAISQLKTSKQRSPNTLNRRRMGWKRLWSCSAYHLSIMCAISGFRRKVDETCALLGYYAAYSDNSLPTFRDNLSGPTFNGQEIRSHLLLSRKDLLTWRLYRQVVPKRLQLTMRCVISQHSADLISVSSLRDNSKALLAISVLAMMQFWCSASFWILAPCGYWVLLPFRKNTLAAF